jgi:hypothetical protein
LSQKRNASWIVLGVGLVREFVVIRMTALKARAVVANCASPLTTPSN